MAETGERMRRLTDAEQRFAKGTLEPGTLAGEYLITELIAQGGGGTVYGAAHRKKGRAAAVKVLHQSLTVLPKMVERFQREVDVLNLLHHPSIVEVWEVGTLPDGRPFFAMERVCGKTVSKIIEDGGRMLPDEAIAILEPVCLALMAAHSAGVIHRDIKTSNIMVMDGPPRQVKLLDFGVAKLTGPMFSSHGLTSEGQPIGTPASMAPEQILAHKVDARVDIYALGVLLYRMLTGRPPFVASSALAQMRQHLEQPAPRPSLRAPAATALDPIVLRCMEKDPDRRYGSVEELLSALKDAVSGAPRSVETPPGTADVGAAIYVQLRLQPDCDDDDGHVSEQMGDMLSAAEDLFVGGDLLIGFATGNEVLGVCPLSVAPAQAARKLALVVDLAMSLRKRFDHYEREEPRLHANICVHVDEVVFKKSSVLEVAGGPLVRADLWAPEEDIGPVCATSATMKRLHNRDIPAEWGSLVPLSPPADPDQTAIPRK